VGDALDDYFATRDFDADECGQEEDPKLTRFMKRTEDAGYEVGRVRVDRISERAILVTYLDGPHAGDTDQWVPKSQIHSTSEVNDTTLLDEEGTLVISAWLAGKRGWKK
jgi:hypothetical protein